MERRSRIITFVIAAVFTYGSLFAFVGPEKVRAWHKHHRVHHGHYHDYDSCHHHDRDTQELETEEENL